MTRASLALLAGALAVALTACSVDADFSDAVGEITTLSAEEHRAEIQQLDRLAFDPGEMTDARRAKLEAGFEALADRVKAAGDTRFLKLESLELRQLAMASKRMTAPQIQTQWMRLRNNLFDDQWWFARSAEDLDAVAAYQPTPAPTKMSSEVFALRPTPDAGPPPGPPQEPELEGRWTILEITANGKPNHDPELSGASLQIQGDRFRFVRADGYVREYSFKAVRDASGNAIYLQNDPDARDENGWVIWEISNGVLRLALYDSLGKRPTSFTAPEGTEPELIVVRLVRSQ